MQSYINPYLFIILMFFFVSCNEDDFEKISPQPITQNEEPINFGEDFILDDGWLFNNKTNINRFSTRINAERSGAFEDSDGDGLADYAEENIQYIFDPEVYESLSEWSKLSHPSLELILNTVNGELKVPLYKTTMYHNEMISMPYVFSDHEYRDGTPYTWSEEQIETVESDFKKIKKVWLVPEFYNFVRQTFSPILRNDLIDRLVDVERKIYFTQINHALGESNRNSYIALNTNWVNEGGDGQLLTRIISHEFAHHLGYDHNGIPYGTDTIATRLVREKAWEYDLFDLNKKTHYVNPCIPASANNNNNYHSIHNLTIPNTGVNIRRHWKGDYEVYATPVTFNRGESYQSITRLLNGGKYSIWIDFNDDAEFSDSERLLFNVRVSSRWRENIHNFTMPNDAQTGVHRMRIVKSTFHSAQPCRYVKGQAIDFTHVTIQ